MKRRSFQEAQKLVKILAVALVLVLLAALFLTAEGSRERMALLLVSVVLLMLMLAAIYFYCRCPSCNRVIFYKVLRTTVCPHCRRNLMSGKKR